MSEADPFIGAYIPFTAILLINGWVFWYFRSLCERYEDLQELGLTANAVVSACKSYNTRSGRVLRVEYDYKTATGDDRKSKCDVAYSKEAEQEYAKDSSFVILYAPDDRKKTNYPQKRLPEAIKGLQKMNKIIPLILLINVGMIYYILFIGHHHSYN